MQPEVVTRKETYFFSLSLSLSLSFSLSLWLWWTTKSRDETIYRDYLHPAYSLSLSIYHTLPIYTQLPQTHTYFLSHTYELKRMTYNGTHR